jgi:hypothetical protein
MTPFRILSKGRQRFTKAYLRSLGYDEEEIASGFAQAEQEHENQADEPEAAE